VELVDSGGRWKKPTAQDAIAHTYISNISIHSLKAFAFVSAIDASDWLS